MPSRKPLSVRERALQLLTQPDFFGEVRRAVERGGLVGEARNALAIYIVAISSLLEKPLNALVKGPSSGGKNFVVSRVLRLIPKDAIREITSSSRTAWNFSKNDFEHRVVYLQERNDAAGAVQPLRLLISEGRLERIVTARKDGAMVAETFVAKGPIASISTTTRDLIDIDDETRHLSLWSDDSIEQTRRIIERQVSPLAPLEEKEVSVWHEAYELISKRATVPVTLPRWFRKLTGTVFVDDVRVRRYFPAFLSAVETVALIRSFKEHPEDYESGEFIQAKFVDYAIAWYIFDRAFTESLNRGSDEYETAKTLAVIAASQGDQPVDADEFAKYSRISYDKASAKLRSAQEAGTIEQKNKPTKNNNKRYLPAKRSTFLPDPKEVRELLTLKQSLELVHPLDGKIVKFRAK